MSWLVFRLHICVIAHTGVTPKHAYKKASFGLMTTAGKTMDFSLSCSKLFLSSCPSTCHFIRRKCSFIACIHSKCDQCPSRSHNVKNSPINTSSSTRHMPYINLPASCTTEFMGGWQFEEHYAISDSLKCSTSTSDTLFMMWFQKWRRGCCTSCLLVLQILLVVKRFRTSMDISDSETDLSESLWHTLVKHDAGTKDNLWLANSSIIAYRCHSSWYFTDQKIEVKKRACLPQTSVLICNPCILCQAHKAIPNLLYTSPTSARI